jgi:hypothetical protein
MKVQKMTVIAVATSFFFIITAAPIDKHNSRRQPVLEKRLLSQIVHSVVVNLLDLDGPRKRGEKWREEHVAEVGENAVRLKTKEACIKLRDRLILFPRDPKQEGDDDVPFRATEWIWRELFPGKKPLPSERVEFSSTPAQPCQ